MMSKIDDLLKKEGKTFEDFYDKNTVGTGDNLIDLLIESPEEEDEKFDKKYNNEREEDNDESDYIEIDFRHLKQILDILDYMETEGAEKIIMGKYCGTGKFEKIKRVLSRFCDKVEMIIDRGGEPKISPKDFERIRLFIIAAGIRRKAAECMEKEY